MISIKTRIRISDNCGARIGECIKVLRSKYYNAKLADMVIVAVKVALTNKKVKRHDVVKGVVVRMTKKSYRTDLDIWFFFRDNAMIFIDPRKGPNSSRMFGPCTQELRFAKQIKIISKMAFIF